MKTSQNSVEENSIEGMQKHFVVTVKKNVMMFTSEGLQNGVILSHLNRLLQRQNM